MKWGEAPMEMPRLDPGLSHGSISIEGDRGLTLFSSGDTLVNYDPATEARLQLHPDQPLVIGRLNGIAPPYLDPHYLPTPLLPGTNRTILKDSGRSAEDGAVSRAHFMLRGGAEGMTLVNGVPHVEGGIRPPTNGTWLLEPEFRLLNAGEEFVIPHGSAAKIHLPNGAVVKICADP